MARPIVGFAGMTHLGLVSASAVASAGFETICFDPDSALITRLCRHDWHVIEPGLDELIRGNGDRQSFSANIAALNRCDVVYVAPDIPTDDDGTSDTSGLTTLIEQVAAVLSPTAVLVVLSQVPPGFTRALKVLTHERLYYQVETLVFGRAVERATKPERYIIGLSEPSRPLDPRLRTILEAFGCPILPMRYESAELAKISINCCLVASISVANTLSEICERIGADWSEIAPALKLDRRIGAYSYLSPGLGIAGGNLERDLATVRRFADRHGADADIVAAWQRNSQHRRTWPLRQLHTRVLSRMSDPLIGILGVTYKENTHSIKNSPAVALIKDLKPYALRVFDPAIKPSSDWHPRLTITAEALAVCDQADALVVMTPWPIFTSLKPADIARRLRGRVVIDPFAMLDRTDMSACGLDHIILGTPLRVHA